MLRTALFGGTFDPIHNAHLSVAKAAADRFSLDRILFVPAAKPPHKTGQVITPYEHRIRMVELACAADQRFVASRLEEGEARSFSILTIEKLRKTDPGPLYFLIGADAFAELCTWHRWQEIVQSVEFIVAMREALRYEVPPGARVHELTGFDMKLSSSGIRQLLAQGSDEALVPPAVMAYIRAHGLYQSQQAVNFANSSEVLS